MERKMYFIAYGFLILWLVHLAAPSSSSTAVPPATTISSTMVSLSSFTDDSSMRVHSRESNDSSIQIANAVTIFHTYSDGTSLVTAVQTRGINLIPSTAFQVSDLTSTTTPSRSIQSSSPHITSDQQSRTSLHAPVTIRYMNGNELLSQAISLNTEATQFVLATESFFSASSLAGPSYDVKSSMEEETNTLSSLEVTISETEYLSVGFTTTPSAHWTVSSPFGKGLHTDESLHEYPITISSDSINFHFTEFRDTTKLAYSTFPEHSSDTVGQTSPLPVPNMSLQSLINSAPESNLVISSSFLQPSTSMQEVTWASFNHFISSNSLPFQSSGSLRTVEGNSAIFETSYSSLDVRSIINSQYAMSSVLPSDNIPEIETMPFPAPFSTVSALNSKPSANEIISSSPFNDETLMLSSLIFSNIESTVSKRSHFSSSVDERWTTRFDDVDSSIVTDESQMSPSAIEELSQSSSLNIPTLTFNSLNTYEMFHSSAIQSSLFVSSSEIPTYSELSTITSASVSLPASPCAFCSTISDMNINSTRTDTMDTLIFESNLQNQTKSPTYSHISSLSIPITEISRFSTSVSSMLLDSSSVRTDGSNDTGHTPSFLFSVSSRYSSLDVSPTSIDFTYGTMYHNMSTHVLTSPMPSSDNVKNLTLELFLEGNCDFIMINHNVFTNFWGSLIQYTQKAANLSIGQYDISLLEMQCDPFRAVISITTDKKTLKVVEKFSNYFHRNSSHPKISIDLNNGTKIVVIITHYRVVPTVPFRLKSEIKTPLSEIVVITAAALICGILIIFGLIIFIREYHQKRKSEGFHFRAESSPERVALRSLPRTSDEHGSSLEMKDAGSMGGAYNNAFESEYSTVGSQNGRKTAFMTRSDMSLSGRSKIKGRKHVSTSHTTFPSSNGTVRPQDTKGYGLVIGLLGYKTRSKEAADTYAVPNKKNKVQGLSIRSMGEGSIEPPILQRENCRSSGQGSDGSPTPPPRHLRSIPKHKEATDSIEKLVASGAKRDDERTEGVVNLAYTDDDKRDDVIGSTPSVHL